MIEVTIFTKLSWWHWGIIATILLIGSIASGWGLYRMEAAPKKPDMTLEKKDQIIHHHHHGLNLDFEEVSILMAVFFFNLTIFAAVVAYWFGAFNS